MTAPLPAARALFGVLRSLSLRHGLRLATTPRDRPGRYAAMLALVLVALLARLALTGALPPTGFPFLTFFPAVALAALYGGLGPGLAGVVLSTLAAKWFFIPGVGSLLPATGQEVIAVAFFAGVELLEVAIIHLMYRALAQARAAQARSVELAAALQEREATLDLAAVFVRDLDGTIRHWSAGCERLYGWTAAEAVGRASHELLRTVFPVPFPEIEAALDHCGAWTGDLHHRTRDGRGIVVSAYKVLRRDGHGRPAAVMESVTDVTEARRAEAALATSDARLRFATDNAHIGLVVVSAEHRYLFSNRAYLEIFGLSMADIVGLRVADVLAPLYEAQIRPRLERAFRGERVEYELVRHANPGGRDAVFRITYEPGRDEAGAPVVVVVVDVTEQTRAARLVAESEARLRRVLDSLFAFVGVLAPDGTLLDVNQAPLQAARIGIEAVRGRPFWECAWWSHDPAVQRRLRRAVERAAAGEPSRYDAEVRMAGDSRMTIDFQIAPLRDAEGRITHLIPSAVDVTEQRRAAAELVENEARFRATFEQAAVGVAHVGLNGSWLLVNARLCDMLGYTEAELRARTFQDITHPDDLEADLDNVRRLLTGEIGTYSMEKRYLRKDGATLWIELTVSLLRGQDGAPRHFISVVQDIAARKAAEVAQAESAERLRLALEAGRMGLWSWDLAADRLAWDARQFELFGMDPAAGQPTGQAALARVHPEDRAGLDAAIRSALEAGNGVFSQEFRVCLEGGAVRWIDGHGHAIPGPDGHAARMVGLNFDVTERKEAEVVLARGNAELELLVAERTRDLERTQQQLAHAQRMEALGQLAGGIAHDFNNVLQAVQGGAGLIGKRAGENAEVRRFAQMVSDAAARGSAITHRLLAFSRRGALRAEAVAPVALLGDMREIFAHTLGAAIAVQVRTEPGLLRLLADKGQLETVLINLATNARDAMPDGGTLTLSATLDVMDHDGPPSGVAWSAAPMLKAGCYVRLCVTDTGLGMAPGVLARVTEPFFTTKPQGKGTGLGLAMAKGFAEQSSGGLAIESAPGQGTTVMLWFPVSAQQAATPTLAAEGPHQTAQADQERRIRIMLVDDDAIVREVMAEGLKTEGFLIRVSESGAAVLALLDAGEPADLLISDLSMPGMDGLALIREAQKRRPDLPAILLTGFATNAAELAVGGAISGTFSLLRKPVTVRQVTERIEMLLEGAEVGGRRGRPS